MTAILTSVDCFFTPCAICVYYCTLHAIFISRNKNAFQWDAYRPLVDRIPAYTVQGGVCLGGVSAPWGCLPRGVCPGGVCPGGPAWGGCLPGGMSGQGVSGQGCLPGGCLPSGGCLPGEGCLPLVLGGVYPSMQWSRHSPSAVDRHNLRKLRSEGGNYRQI